jgi:hypothetical protein
LYHDAADIDGADIVIPLDADEFIQAPDENCFRESLASYLKKVSHTGTGVIIFPEI